MSTINTEHLEYFEAPLYFVNVECPGMREYIRKRNIGTTALEGVEPALNSVSLLSRKRSHDCVEAASANIESNESLSKKPRGQKRNTAASEGVEPVLNSVSLLSHKRPHDFVEGVADIESNESLSKKPRGQK